MDPIEDIKVAKDTSLAMMLAAQKRGWELWYFKREDLSMRDGVPATYMQSAKVYDDSDHWYELGAIEQKPLSSLCLLYTSPSPRD